MLVPTQPLASLRTRAEGRRGACAARPLGPGPRRRPGPGVRPGGSEGRERYQAQGEGSLQRGPQRERACCGGRRTGSGLFAPQQSLKQNLSSPGHAALRPVLRRVPPGRARARMRPVCLASSCARARPRGRGAEASRRPSVRRLKARDVENAVVSGGRGGWKRGEARSRAAAVAGVERPPFRAIAQLLKAKRAARRGSNVCTGPNFSLSLLFPMANRDVYKDWHFSEIRRSPRLAWITTLDTT